MQIKRMLALLFVIVLTFSALIAIALGFEEGVRVLAYGAALFGCATGMFAVAHAIDLIVAKWRE